MVVRRVVPLFTTHYLSLLPFKVTSQPIPIACLESQTPTHNVKPIHCGEKEGKASKANKMNLLEHGCQMAIAKIIDCRRLALWA